MKERKQSRKIVFRWPALCLHHTTFGSGWHTHNRTIYRWTDRHPVTPRLVGRLCTKPGDYRLHLSNTGQPPTLCLRHRIHSFGLHSRCRRLFTRRRTRILDCWPSHKYSHSCRSMEASRAQGSTHLCRQPRTRRLASRMVSQSLAGNCFTRISSACGCP